MCIDDKISLQIFSQHVPAGASPESHPARDAIACSQADDAYEAVGLTTHPKKRVCRASVVKVWEAHIDGDSGVIAMDSTKLMALVWQTARLAAIGYASERLLQKVSGLWGDDAYEAVGLTTHPKKRVCRASVVKVWEAHIDGDSGVIAMDSTKLMALVWQTARLAAIGYASERLLQKVSGLWAFACQFRRPLFSVFDALYSTSHPSGDPNLPFKLPRELVQEPQVMSSLGLLALTDLRTQVCETLYATDSSPSGAGIVACHVGPEVAKELYRRRDSRGFYTKLLSPHASNLRGKGLEVDEPELVMPPDNVPERAQHDTLKGSCYTSLSLTAVGIQLLQRFGAASFRVRDLTSEGFHLDFIEVYFGEAVLSRHMKLAGFSVGPPIELKRVGTCWSETSFSRLGFTWLGPPCATFSLARKPRLRSRESPWGLDPLEEECCIGGLHMRQSLALFCSQLNSGALAVVETPWGGCARCLPFWHLAVSAAHEVRADYCRYWKPYLKPTTLLISSPELAPLGRRCRCKCGHERLEGSKTSQASVYPEELCQEVASLAVRVAALQKEQSAACEGG